MVEPMETPHGMISFMTASPVQGPATAADLVALERHEVVAGQLVPKAAPSFEHGAVQHGIGVAIGGFRGHGGGEGRPGGWWIGTGVEIDVDYGLEPHEVYVPDMAGWRIARVPEAPSGQPVQTKPDWVCEILSPSTAGRDLGHKLRTYHRALIGYYWVADPINQTLTVYRWHDAGYVLATAAGAGERVRAEPFAVIELDTADIFGAPPRKP